MRTALRTGLSGLLTLAPLLVSAAGDIGFEERFALPEQREAALRELIPGTEEYYYYQALHAQNSGQLAQVPPLLQQWSKRHGETARYKEIKNRQALLDYPADHRRALDYLRQLLDLRFDHQREQEQAPAQYPAALDPALVSEEAFRKQALARHGDLSGFEDHGLDRMVCASLSPEERRDLLRRLPLPDLEGVTELVIAELRERDSRGFGAFPIHQKLLRAQLDACRQALQGTERDLSGNDAFVAACLARLAPSPDSDIGADAVARRAYLAGVHAFAAGLPASQNALKASALYRLLDHDRRQGRYDPSLFAAYLRLPRAVSYIRRDYLARPEFAGRAANLNRAFSSAPMLEPIVNDEPLVRDYLSRFLLDVADYRAFSEWLDEDYLKQVFAETKILAGVGNMEQWYGLMPPAAYQALKERVDVELLPANPLHFGADDAVALDLAVKHVDKLRVTVYDIDAFNYYREHGEEIAASVDLDGCVPNHERVIEYKDIPPLRRHIERIPLPQLAAPGLYVVEFFGNGVSSRALIRKGRLRCVERVGSAGHVFTLLDDAARPVKGASLWLGGQEFAADADGEVVVPFSTRFEAREQTAILRHGRLASLARFRHQPESYDLRLGWLLDRESLLAGEQATLLLRPALTANGRPASLKLLERPVLELRLRDADGIEAVQRLEQIALQDDEDFVHRFRVPPRIRQVDVAISGQVRNLSQNRDDVVRDSASLELNGLVASARVESLLLRRVAEGYVLDAHGRNGEALPSRTVRLAFKHRLFREPVELVLQGDARGRIALGKLPGIESVKSTDFAPQSWALGDEARVNLPEALHILEGGMIELPAAGLAAGDLRSGLSLLGRAPSGAFTHDLLECAKAEAGILRIAGLPPGDYQLTYREQGRQVAIRVTRGVAAAHVLAGAARGLEATPSQPLQIAALEARDGKLRVRLLRASPATRVHLLARRTLCGGDHFDGYAAGMPAASSGRWEWPLPPGSYLSGRAVGDEARYVLERRDAARFPGNMLERPSLLLTPWSRKTTETDVLQARLGDEWEAAAAPAPMRQMYGRMHNLIGETREMMYEPMLGSALDFLPAPARLWSNLRPDGDGVVEIPLAELEGRQEIVALAADTLSLASRRLALAETPLQTRDLRLAQALDARQSHAERKLGEGVVAGVNVTIADLPSARLENYDSLAKLFRLFQALAPDETFGEFAFVTEWPTLPPARRQELYSKYACHELDFFLYHKDRAFFDSVVKPHLTNKRDKQFMDRWLLGQDVSAWFESAAFRQLNYLERILLGRRIAARRDDVTRHLADLCNLLPPDPEDEERRFQTALRSGGMESGGFQTLQDAAVDALEKKARPRGELAEPPASRPAVVVAPSAPPPPAEDPMNRKAAADAKGDLAKALAEEGRDKDTARRRSKRQLFREPEQTREWLETHYYRTLLEEQAPERVPVNAFWRDYAAAPEGRPFLSGHVVAAAGGFTERLCALAVLDLPFQAKPHRESVDGARYTLTAGSPAVIFHQQVVAAAPGDPSRPVMVVENFFDVADRYRMVGNERVDRFVRDEFVAGRVYGAQVVLTNPTSSRRRLSLLTQVPEGALPLAGGLHTRSVPVQLEPYATARHEYYFYFPEARATPAAHYPAGAAEAGAAVGRAEMLSFKVVAHPSQQDRGSWDYVSQRGTSGDVLAFLEQENAHAPSVALERIAWRLRDRDFYGRALALLERRGIYRRALWGYALLHDDVPRIRQLLGAADEPFRLTCGHYLRSPLLDVDSERFNVYEHKEYWPLINARAHALGKRRAIANQSFAAQYRLFLEGLAYRAALGARERLALAAYLLLQDRLEEARAQFAQVRPEDVETRLQHVYFRAYLAFSEGRPEEARKLAAAYEDYAVPRWRDRFRNVMAQADEVRGAAAAVQNADRREEVQDRLAAEAPSLAVTLTGDKIALAGRNLAACQVRLYPIDVELLFSRTPFMGGEQAPGRFTFVRPAWEQRVALGRGESARELELPAAYRRRNLIVEAAAEGVPGARVSHTPNGMDVQVVANYGQLRVRRADNGKPLAGAYVKVYARAADGAEPRFHKDGYTDLRGVFDYASISTAGLGAVEEFAVLVLDDNLGAVIRQAPPPPR